MPAAVRWVICWSTVRCRPIRNRSEERRVGKECRSLCDWSSDVCSSDLIHIAGSLTVDAGGVYAGGGSVGNLLVNGTLQTNTQLGTATVVHDLTFGSGGILAYGVNADGSSAPVVVGGTANLNGATLAVNPGSGTYPWQSNYTVLQAASINGTFGKVTSDYAFLTPTLAYTPTQVDLTYTRNDIAFNQFAATGNGS